MIGTIKNNRVVENEVGSIFTDRWSPRSFSSRHLNSIQINSLFEAARWAPSCYNEQPWLFMYACKDHDRNIFLSLLNEKNKLWASKAPLLIFALANRNFQETNKENKHALFDVGSAWLSLALQARRMGLFSHAMAGFNEKKSYQVLNISKAKYKVVVAIAVGYYGNIDYLNEEFRKLEKPNKRKPINEIISEGINFKE